MKRLLILLAAGVGAAPAIAQHEGHGMPEAGNQLSSEGQNSASDPHAGHVMPMEAAAAPAAETPPPAEAFSGPRHAADTLFDTELMARVREDLRAENGDFRSYWIMADQLESRIREGDEGYRWDVQGWYGGDINKLWLKSEGEGTAGESPEDWELQALWSRAIAPWWDLQVGIRHDFRPRPQQGYLVLGLQGLAPYQFETDLAAFLSEEGDLSARVEAEYELWITQRLVLQPRVELDLASQRVPATDSGSSRHSSELGLRLHYQFAREFAPYIGIEYERHFGEANDAAGATGDDSEGWRFVLGLRAWF